jgi:hypothetical protein
MQYTNKAKTHPAIAGYLQSQHYFLKGDISTTGLIKSPRESQLLKRHDAEIVVDVASLYKSKAGTEFHAGVQRFIAENKAMFPHVLSEQPLEANIAGWEVTGTADIIDLGTNQLWDMKNSSIWAKIFGAKPEYKAQLNIYRAMSMELGIRIDKLFIAFGFTDWHKSDLYKKDYPKQEIDILEIPVWPIHKTRDYMWERVAFHQANQDATDDELPDCTGCDSDSNERWEKPSKFAIYSGKFTRSKRASKLCNTLIEAKSWVDGKKDPSKYSIYFRRGEQTKCKDWCDAAPFCNQWAKLKATELEEI